MLGGDTGIDSLHAMTRSIVALDVDAMQQRSIRFIE
jgi:hypothetical protein